MRDQVTLECVVCRNRNYTVTKNKKIHPSRLEFKKYCRFCKVRTLHKETK
ncbi:MAG: 50S ribosomal protein L33 [Clostridiales bacterium]|nr:50S ribosomal protein L33 [Clostridiales bacterium]